LVPQRSGVGATTAVFVVVIVVIVGVMGIVSFASQSGSGTVSSITSTITSTTTEEQQSTSYSTASPSGLQIQVRLNATSIPSGSALSAQITLFNPLNANLSVSGGNSSSTITTWDGYDFVCNGYGREWSLAGYGLFKGHYSSDNISSAGDPLMLAPPVGASCVTFPSPSLFVFLSGSSNATAYYPSRDNLPPEMDRFAINATTEYCENLRNAAGSSYTRCPVGASLFGYWSSPSFGRLEGSELTLGSSYFHYFSPGQYTLVVEDVWFQAIYAHFQVTPASGRPIEVVSVRGPMSPYDPAVGTAISMALENSGSVPVSSLNATLDLGRPFPYSFVFDVSPSLPLLTGQTVQKTEDLWGAGFQTGVQYPVTISGALTNGTQFSYTEQIQIVPSG
jgi:hypothetical protein